MWAVFALVEQSKTPLQGDTRKMDLREAAEKNIQVVMQSMR